MIISNTGSACKEKKIGDKDLLFGLTYPMLEIGKYAQPGTPHYELGDDINLSVCLDKRDTDKTYWQFNITNIRMV